MVKFREITIKEHWPHGYIRGGRPALKCTVELQYGPGTYETVKVDLVPEAVSAVVQLAVQKAMDQLTLDPASIDVVGSAKPEAAEEEIPEAPVVLDSEPMVIAEADAEAEEML